MIFATRFIAAAGAVAFVAACAGDTKGSAGTSTGALIAAAVAGVLAAIFPGRRAARIDILRAITTE